MEEAERWFLGHPPAPRRQVSNSIPHIFRPTRARGRGRQSQASKQPLAAFRAMTLGAPAHKSPTVWILISPVRGTHCLPSPTGTELLHIHTVDTVHSSGTHPMHCTRSEECPYRWPAPELRDAACSFAPWVPVEGQDHTGSLLSRSCPTRTGSVQALRGSVRRLGSPHAQCVGPRTSRHGSAPGDSLPSCLKPS